jgi:aspartate/glutamate racemase
MDAVVLCKKVRPPAAAVIVRVARKISCAATAHFYARRVTQMYELPLLFTVVFAVVRITDSEIDGAALPAAIGTIAENGTVPFSTFAVNVIVLAACALGAVAPAVVTTAETVPVASPVTSIAPVTR